MSRRERKKEGSNNDSADNKINLIKYRKTFSGHNLQTAFEKTFYDVAHERSEGYHSADHESRLNSLIGKGGKEKELNNGGSRANNYPENEATPRFVFAEGWLIHRLRQGWQPAILCGESGNHVGDTGWHK